MINNPTEIQQRFFSSLKLGTGEAYLLLQDYPAFDFSKFIIKGATTNFAYDPQSEGSRATYIYRFIKKSKQKDKIIRAVLAELKARKDDYWALDQMCDLAVLLYKEGYSEAKEALYQRFDKNYSEGFEFCGQDQLMEVDGLNGLLTVAEKIGKSILDDGNWEDSWHVDNFQNRNKTIDAYAALKSAGRKNRYIKAYYRSIVENKWTLSKRRKPVKYSYELIKEKIEANKFRFISVERANDLPLQEVERLATDFLQEKEAEKKTQYLYFFTKRPFPFHYKVLLEIAKGRNPKGTRLVEYAADALQFFKGKDIRQWALEKLKKSRKPYNYLNLLVSNYRPGDYKMLCELANRSHNYNFIHALVFGFIAIYKENKSKECKGPLEIIYSRMNCGIHRKDIVRLLWESNVLSQQIQKELAYDSYDEVRGFYKRQKNGS